MEYDVKTNKTMTLIHENYPWFEAISKAVRKHKFEIEPKIFPAGTDCAFIRNAGIPAFGFSPMPNTPVLLHDHNEFLNEKVFMDGIDLFVDVIVEMASV